MTRRQRVLQLLKIKEMSCSEICFELLGDNLFSSNRNPRLTKNSLTSSLSGTLNQMVVRGEIEYAPTKAIRGGAIYKLKII